jgi:uroporphyrinogen III methyltransferase/synthase
MLASIGNKKSNALPLAGRRIVITRAREQAEEFSDLLEDYGAEVIPFPTIEIAPPGDWFPLDNTIETLDSYDWVIFTSVNGVRFFTQRLKEKGKDITVLAEKKICAIGPRTQGELENMGLTVTFMPTEYRVSLEAILSKRIDVVTFTSSSTVRNFMELVSDKTVMYGIKVAVIGPITAETVRSYGLEPHITPAEYTIPALVQAIVEYFTQPHP